MAEVVRAAGYTGYLQRIIWSQGDNVPVTAYLWGGGGGGGGYDSNPGGSGCGGAFTTLHFTINEGDTLEVAVGGGGGAGGSSQGNAPGGVAGASYITDYLFNTRDAAANPPVFGQFNSAYCTFLNTYGVWVNPSSAATFDRTYTVNFPVTGNYQFTACSDNSARFFIDGVERFYTDNYASPWTVGYEVTAGNHTIRILGTNTGGPGAVALTIGQGDSYSGGRGGNSGGSGSSGAGGGGGGATVVILNNNPIGAAGGGGGGGGGGNSGVAVGQSAPGSRGQAAIGENAGQNGTNKDGDGGGGGGGGGGWGGGQGGTTPGGDQGGYAGSFGLSSSPYEIPSGRTPGGTSNPYWRGSVAQGGLTQQPGNSGYAVFVFEASGLYVKNENGWNQVNNTYVKVNNQWNQVQSVYIKNNGTWVPINGSTTPVFENVVNRFGVNPRSGVIETPAGDPVSYGGDSGGFDGGGGGGGCFLAGTEIIMADGTVKAIEHIEAGDMILEALTNQPARVIGIKTRAHDISKWVFSLHKEIQPYITEEHPFYNDANELCAVSELAQTMAPWLGPIKIVDVANKKKISEPVTVYNLMLETGESHWANGVRVNNIVKTGGTYALVYRGFLDHAVYESHVYNQENQTVSPEQQTLIFNYTLKLTNYVLHNNNIRSKILGRLLSWALRNRKTLYPYISAWFRSPVRRWLFGKNI